MQSLLVYGGTAEIPLLSGVSPSLPCRLQTAQQGRKSSLRLGQKD
jgi:hypothetical protein